MKKLFTLLAIAMMAITAFADDQVYTIFSWESPNGVPVGFGGRIYYENGVGNRYNYANSDYYTICLNGKKANMNDETASANAGHFRIAFDDKLMTGDIITLTAYYNKGEDKEVSAYFKTWTGVEFTSDVVTSDIARGNTPQEIQVVVPEGVEDKSLYITREKASTNMFITKIEIKGKRSKPVITATPSVHQFSSLEDLKNLSITFGGPNLKMLSNYAGCTIAYGDTYYAAWYPMMGVGSAYTFDNNVLTLDNFGTIEDVTTELPTEPIDLFLNTISMFEDVDDYITTYIRYVPGDPTAIQNTEAAAKNVKKTKIIENGKLMILHNGKKFNVIGIEQ